MLPPRLFNTVLVLLWNGLNRYPPKPTLSGKHGLFLKQAGAPLVGIADTGLVPFCPFTSTHVVFYQNDPLGGLGARILELVWVCLLLGIGPPKWQVSFGFPVKPAPSECNCCSGPYLQKTTHTRKALFARGENARARAVQPGIMSLETPGERTVRLKPIWATESCASAAGLGPTMWSFQAKTGNLWGRPLFQEKTTIRQLRGKRLKV